MIQLGSINVGKLSTNEEEFLIVIWKIMTLNP